MIVIRGPDDSSPNREKAGQERRGTDGRYNDSLCLSTLTSRLSTALAWLQINFLPLSTRSKNRTTVEVSIHMSEPSCHDGSVWPCNGALCPCIAASYRESISACHNDDSVAANRNDIKRLIKSFRSRPAPRVGACGERRSPHKQGPPSACS